MEITDLLLVFMCVLLNVRIGVTAVSFLEQPSDEYLVFTHGSPETFSFVLTCQVADLDPTHKVSWLKEGEIISDNYETRSGLTHLIDYRYSVQGDSAVGQYDLQVSPINIYYGVFDAGRYQCRVLETQNEYIIAESDTADVGIYILPREDHPQCLLNNAEVTSGIDVTEDELAVLSCKSDLGTPRVSMAWHRGEDQNPLEPVRSGITDNGLAFIEFDYKPLKGDSGVVFTCSMQHPGFAVPGHERASANCTLGPFNILNTPIVTLEPQDALITHSNDTVVLNCKALANPEVAYFVWIYDDLPVNGNDARFAIANGGKRLTVSGFTSEDDGVHTVSCMARNSVGNGTATATLSVMIASTFTVPQITSKQATSSPTKNIATTVETHTPKSDKSVNEKKEPINNIIIIASASGAAIFLIIIIVAIVLICCHRRKVAADKRKKEMIQNFYRGNLNNDICKNNDKQHIQIKIDDTHPGGVEQNVNSNSNTLPDYEATQNDNNMNRVGDRDDQTAPNNRDVKEEAIYVRSSSGEETIFLRGSVGEQIIFLKGNSAGAPSTEQPLDDDVFTDRPYAQRPRRERIIYQ